MLIFEGDKDGECARRGFGFERVAMIGLRAIGYEVKLPTQYEARARHVDFWMRRGGAPWLSVDAKAMKKLRRYDQSVQDEWTFIEWMNNQGRDGWLVSGAELMVFERERVLMLIRREELLRWASSKVDFNKHVTRSSEAKYAMYSRQGRADLMSLIRLDEIPLHLYEVSPKPKRR